MTKNKCLIVITILLLTGYSFINGQETDINSNQNTAEKLLNQVLQSEIQYDTFSSFLKCALQKEKKESETLVDVRLRIIKNEVIQFSLLAPILRTEIVKILITPQELLVIDCINKQYFQETLENIKNRIALNPNYFSLEALLTNQLFIFGRRAVMSQDCSCFNIWQDSSNIHLVQQDTISSFILHFTTDLITNRIRSVLINQEENQWQCYYSDWEYTSDKQPFPMCFQFIFNKYKGTLFFKSVEINPPLKKGENIPNLKKYKQISLSALLSLIENSL